MSKPPAAPPLDGSHVGVNRFFKQLALLAVLRFAPVTEADAARGRKLQRQRRDLAVLLGQRGILSGQQLFGLGALLEQGAHFLGHGGNLADALRALGKDDPHVFTIEPHLAEFP